ncbi:MAG: lipase family protein [Cyanobacteria bacterium P01_D01_bin.105]
MPLLTTLAMFSGSFPGCFLGSFSGPLLTLSLLSALGFGDLGFEHLGFEHLGFGQAVSAPEVSEMSGGGLVSVEAIAVTVDAQSLRLSAQLLLGFGAAVAGGALAWGARHYARQQQWQRIEFLRQAVQSFEQDPEIRNALKILDFEEYRDYTIPARNLKDRDQPIVFRVEDELLCHALANHAERTRVKHRIEYHQDHDQLDPEDLRQYQIETALRDWFNKLLNGLEHFGYFLESGLFSEEELWPWLSYWIQLIADPAYRRPGASKFYDALYSYIHSSGFFGVQKLFERYDYRILPSPYKDTDLVAAMHAPLRSHVDAKTPTQPINTQLALTLAKAAYLAYQDKQFIAEVVGRWCVPLTKHSSREVIRHNFRYFHNHGRDTQAFMFRTDKFMVLAFRGSQESKDWLTNFTTQLRNFTIYKDGVAANSSYRGRVHKGFFLAWAIIEKSVLAQMGRWRQDCADMGNALPPLYITGHSLGGALATIAAAALAEHGIEVAGVYTFGQPRVGDRTFVRQLNNITQGKVFRFVNNNDIVPHVPPPFSIWNPTRLYGHVGGATYFNRKGVITANVNHSLRARAADALLGITRGVISGRVDHISDHRMEYYISHLDNMLKKEMAEQAATHLDADESAATAMQSNKT